MTVAFDTHGGQTFSIRDVSHSPADVDTLKKELEGNDVELKVEAMEDLLLMLVGEGEDAAKANSLLMHVIRFVMPTKEKKLKKLALLYLENVKKYDSDGSLKHEMILVWYRNLL